MPVFLVDRLGPDTRSKLQRAATARFKEAEILERAGAPAAAIYFFGYSVEMTVKAAYFRAIGFHLHQAISIQDRRDAINEWAVLRLPQKPGPHDVVGWAQLLVYKRVALGDPYSRPFGLRIIDQTRAISLRWSEQLRYRVNVPSAREVEAVRSAARWFRQNRARF